ncbi:MAG: NfeD family protein [Mangrovibacterium sp.]|nr:NfeD family protein [Mangrovibacterium sp.]
MTILIILFLIFLGVLLLLLEFAVVPGVTIAGIGGVILMGASIYMAFDAYGLPGGFLTLAVVVVVVPVLFLRFFKGRAGKKMILESEITGKVNESETATVKAGDEGITIGRLAPMGKVRINGQVLEGKSPGGFIDQQVKVRVVEVLKTQVIVERISEN